MSAFTTYAIYKTPGIGGATNFFGSLARELFCGRESADQLFKQAKGMVKCGEALRGFGVETPEFNFLAIAPYVRELFLEKYMIGIPQFGKIDYLTQARQSERGRDLRRAVRAAAEQAFYNTDSLVGTVTMPSTFGIIGISSAFNLATHKLIHGDFSHLPVQQYFKPRLRTELINPVAWTGPVLEPGEMRLLANYCSSAMAMIDADWREFERIGPTLPLGESLVAKLQVHRPVRPAPLPKEPQTIVEDAPRPEPPSTFYDLFPDSFRIDPTWGRKYRFKPSPDLDLAELV